MSLASMLTVVFNLTTLNVVEFLDPKKNSSPSWEASTVTSPAISTGTLNTTLPKFICPMYSLPFTLIVTLSNAS